MLSKNPYFVHEAQALFPFDLSLIAFTLLVGLLLLSMLIGGRKLRARRASGATDAAERSETGRAGDPAAAKAAPPAAGDLPADPGRHLQAVTEADFETVPLFGRTDAGLVQALEQALETRGDGYRLMARVALGAVLRPCGMGLSPQALAAAHAAIAARQLDLAVFNRFGFLVTGILRGPAHPIASEDAVVQEALRLAGVPLLELPAGASPQQAVEDLRRLLPAPVRGDADLAEPVQRTAPESAKAPVDADVAGAAVPETVLAALPPGPRLRSLGEGELSVAELAKELFAPPKPAAPMTGPERVRATVQAAKAALSPPPRRAPRRASPPAVSLPSA